MNLKNIALVVLFSVVLFGLTGCGGSSGGNPASPVLSSTVTGTIRNSQEVPIPGADVRLYKSEDAYKQSLTQGTKLSGTAAAMRLSQVGDNLQTRTDERGVYTFNNVPDGEYTLLAMAGNTIQYTQPGIRIDKTRSSLITVDAQLTPTGNASGTVKLNGVGVGGLVLYLDKTSYLTITSSDGSFVFNGIPAGQTYTLKILEAPITGKSDEVFAFASTNPTITIQPATTVTTGLSGISLTRKISSLYKYAISGYVLNSNSEFPVADQIIIAINSSLSYADSLRGGLVTYTTPEITYTRTQADGSYTLYLTTPGTYLVAVLSLEKNELVEPAMQMVTISSSNSILDPAECETFFLSSGYKVSGVIANEQETPIPGVNIVFSSLEPERFYTTTSGIEGKYALYLPEGTYNVSVSSDYEIVSPSVTELTVSYDTTNNVTVQKLVGSATPLITVWGPVRDITTLSTPVPNLLIQFTTEYESYFTVSRPDGDFSIDLPEGTYSLSVPGEYVLATGTMAEITVVATTTITITPILLTKAAPIVKLEGIITDQFDKKLSGIRIGFTNMISEKIDYAISDINGKYIIDIPEGNYYLSSETDGYELTNPATDTMKIIDGTTSLEGLDIEVLSPAPPPYSINQLSDISDAEVLQGFEAIGDYYYVVTSDATMLYIRRYAHNSSTAQKTVTYSVSEFEEISTAVVGSNLYILVSAFDVEVLSPYLLAYDQNLAPISNDPIDLSNLSSSVTDTSLFAFNNTLYYLNNSSGDGNYTEWYQIPNNNYGSLNSYPDLLAPEMCQDGNYVYYAMIDGYTSSIYVVRQSIYTGDSDTVATVDVASLTPQVCQLSCDATNLKLLVKADDGNVYTSNIPKTPSELQFTLSSSDNSYHIQQGYQTTIEFGRFINYANSEAGLTLSYPTKQYIPGTTDLAPITTYMNPFRKTADRVYVIGETATGCAVITYDEASAATIEMEVN